MAGLLDGIMSPLRPGRSGLFIIPVAGMGRGFFLDTLTRRS